MTEHKSKPSTLLLWIAAIVVLAMIGHVFYVRAVVRDFAVDQLKKRGLEGWDVDDVKVPLTSLFSPKYEVDIGLVSSVRGQQLSAVTVSDGPVFTLGDGWA